MPDAACSTPTESLTYNPTAVFTGWFSKSGRAITVNTSTANLAGTTVVVTVTSTLNDDTSSTNTDYTFTITFAACTASTITPPSVYTATYYLGTAAHSWTIPAYTVAMPDAACATPTETLTFNPTDSNTAWYSVSTRTITVTSSDVSLVGNAAITVTSTLNDVDSSSNNAYTFTITFVQCTASTFTAPSVYTYTYYLGTAAHSWTIPAYTIVKADAACATPTETLTFNPTDANTAWYSVSSRAITVTSSDASLVGN